MINLETDHTERETLADRLRQIERGARALDDLDGKPVGGWPETVQAERRIVDELPLRRYRGYSAGDLIDALYAVDTRTQRYSYRRPAA